MKYLLIGLLLLALWIGSATAQNPPPVSLPPFRLEVAVTYLNAEKLPEMANYVYKKIREIPGVVIVPEKDARVQLIISDVGDGKVYACTCTVLECANYQINLALMPVQLAPKAGNKAADAWKDQLKSGDFIVD